MSKDNKEVTPNSQFSLVRAIVTFFKLGEEGKIEDFFLKQRRILKRDISKLAKANEVMQFTHDNAMEDIDEKIEDAELAVANAFMQVDVERLGSNSDAEAFGRNYWSSIEIAEGNLKTLTESKEKAQEQHKEALKKSKEQIDERNRRLAKISAK